MSNRTNTKRRAGAAALVAAIALSGGALAACDQTPATGVPGGPVAHPTSPHHAPARRTSKQIALYGAMRTAWDQHMQWTYDAVVAFASDSAGLQPTIDRLLQNQVDIGNAVAPYYGKAAAQQLTDLLQTHIKEAVPVLTAAKAGDKAALDAAVADWYANAADIGNFLASANPNWARHDMPEMMKTHITQTIGYATDILTGNYAQAITHYDQAQAHMTEMADMLSAGIVAQFPKKF